MAKGQHLKLQQIVTPLRQIDVLTSIAKRLPKPAKKWARLSKATIAGEKCTVAYPLMDSLWSR